MILYKYLERDYLKRFRKEGKLYINTLCSLRSCDHEPIRDNLEGKYRLIIAPNNKKPINLSSVELKKFYPNVKIAENVPNAFTVMPEALVTSDFEITDVFLFCTSLVKDKRLSEKWKYNSYFKITEPFNFANAIFEKLHEQICMGYFLLDKVKYGFKELEITTENKKMRLERVPKDIADYLFRKPVAYKDEKEFRMVFVPSYKLNIKPIEISCPKLLEYCSFV